MDKGHRIKNHLIFSFVFVFIVCIGIFMGLVFYMNNRSKKTISQVGKTYMASINERVSDHFSTMVDLKIKQLSSLTEALPYEKEDSNEVRKWFTDNSKICEFEALAYYFEDGSYEMIFGEEVKQFGAEDFLSAMKNAEKKITVGINSKNERSAIIGVPFKIKMQNGTESISLVARMSLQYIKDILSLDQKKALVYSFIIRPNGDFVIRTGGAYRDNYFIRVEETYDEVQGKSKEQYMLELKDAMENRQDYSIMFKLDGEWRHIYCSSLPYSEWSLVTILPYGTLNESINEQNHNSLIVFIGNCSILILLLFGIFLGYFHMNRSQIHELQHARKLAEEANKSKSVFLSNMSHDIRTPMNAVVGMTAIALNNLDDKERVRTALKKIELSSRHLLGLINDILDMSKIESGKMTLNVELVSLREIMDGIVNIAQPQIKAKQQNFNVFIYDITHENVLCDSVRLNQLLLNLLSNAIKFTPEGGSIEVSLQEKESPKGSDYVRILFKVKDTGIGMTDEFIEHIFESFVREDNTRVQKTEGAGLGMAITKYIVDAMGGTIEIKSKLGVGTEFIVNLDLQISDETEEMILPDFTMLVVDDDQQLCESTTDSLKSIGIQAEWALDGQHAIKMVKEHHAIHNDYHIILLDWKLPDMDGIRTARELRKELGKEVPILLISAYDCSEIEAEAREAGISGFLSKPLFKSTLYYGLKPFINETDEITFIEKKDIDVSGKRILLAEDNELNWEMASELLREQGLIVEWAKNGKECFDMFKNSELGYYDAILMDIRMPIKNGYEATEMIRKLDREDVSIPIIAMTADAFAEDRERCIKCGMNGHIAKPIDVREVCRVLHKHFTESQDE